jgi:hypothetical protein
MRAAVFVAIFLALFGGVSLSGVGVLPSGIEFALAKNASATRSTFGSAPRSASGSASVFEFAAGAVGVPSGTESTHGVGFALSRRNPHSVAKNSNPIAIKEGESSCGSFRNLSKKFARRDLKSCKKMRAHVTNFGCGRMTMRKVNKYQYRRSHSENFGVPTVKPCESR